MAQVVEHLVSKCKVLSSNSSTTTKKKVIYGMLESISNYRVKEGRSENRRQDSCFSPTDKMVKNVELKSMTEVIK
jgi:hypothetical protein